jgi:hypothetical protein
MLKLCEGLEVMFKFTGIVMRFARRHRRGDRRDGERRNLSNLGSWCHPVRRWWSARRAAARGMDHKVPGAFLRR